MPARRRKQKPFGVHIEGGNEWVISQAQLRARGRSVGGVMLCPVAI